jgi:hypothetical protein
MSTHVSVNTYTHSVNYVTGQMLRSLKEIVRFIGLDINKLLGEWDTLQRGISAWLASKHLQMVTLEIFNAKTDALIGRWDFVINYGYGADEDGSMWADIDAIKYAIEKCGAIASNCSYSVIVKNSDNYPCVSGWKTGAFRSTDGFILQSLGNTIAATSLAAQTGYWRKA